MSPQKDTPVLPWAGCVCHGGPGTARTADVSVYEPRLSGAGALVLTSGDLPIMALALSGVQLSPVAISQSLLVSVGWRTVWPE